ncbi:uncharacterized protein LAESUDRAFT_718472 [Laetiporus sulphureus 93-53]|uniref:Uncharacterized protein n=1 Tax=Laetiporus sulphureus 93-53 TaxID=1314785 RepID=A0A165AXQ0_9APHY|nr:uncharacterized protein LAESUDRAFT_718472 [Laetiporus sulphureus 93-53]KZS99857.1 hypothetical protein LAESUDRAFT_718472 [Laetiporus sulphureus 93-53]
MLKRAALFTPAISQFIALSSPSWQCEALTILLRMIFADSSISSIPGSEIGMHLFEVIARFLENLYTTWSEVVGYKNEDVSKLVAHAITQRQVLDLAPGIGHVASADELEHSMHVV